MRLDHPLEHERVAGVRLDGETVDRLWAPWTCSGFGQASSGTGQSNPPADYKMRAN
jgi:hypothetical protein